MKTNAYFLTIVLLVSGLFIGCGPKPMDFYNTGRQQLSQYNCTSSNSFKTAADMELKDKGDWYPIYSLSLALSRYYCQEYSSALQAFNVIENYVELRSNRDVVDKTFDFLKSKGNRKYELTEREETLLHYYMGMCQYFLGNYSDAMVEFKKVDFIADGLYSKFPLVSLVRGMTYEKMGDKSNALVAYRKIIDENPEVNVGYLLAYRLSVDNSYKEQLASILSSKFGINAKDIDFTNKNEVITIVENGTAFTGGQEIGVDQNNSYGVAVPFDGVSPDFRIGAVLGDIVKEELSRQGRNAVKNVAGNLIPGGSLIAGLFLGGDQAENRSWAVLPKIFHVNIGYSSGKLSSSSIMLKSGGTPIKLKDVSLPVNNLLVFVTNI